MKRLLPVLLVFGRVPWGVRGRVLLCLSWPGSLTSNKFKVEGDMFSSGWSNCVGTYTDSSGEEYIGEWQNGELQDSGSFKTVDLKKT